MFLLFCLSYPSFVWRGEWGGLGEYGTWWHSCSPTQPSSSSTPWLKFQPPSKYKPVLPACFLVMGGMGRRKLWLTGSWLLRARHLLSPLLPSSPELNIALYMIRKERTCLTGEGQDNSERVEEELKPGWNFPETSWALLVWQVNPPCLRPAGLQ